VKGTRSAAGHASLIARALGSSSIDPHSLYEWAMEVSGKAYYASICLDSADEPRWRPDWLGPKMLVPDAFGRVDAVLKRLPEGVTNDEWTRRIEGARKLLGESGVIFTGYPAIGESGGRGPPRLQEMGELATFCQAFIDNPTVDHFLTAGYCSIRLTFGIPAECVPPTEKVIADLRQSPTQLERGKRQGAEMLAIYIAMQLQDRTLADSVAELLIKNASNDGDRPSETVFWLIECATADRDGSRGQQVLARRLETLAFVAGPAYLPDVYDSLRVLQKLDANWLSYLRKPSRRREWELEPLRALSDKECPGRHRARLHCLRPSLKHRRRRRRPRESSVLPHRPSCLPPPAAE
jgi:hypothetical protein